MELQENYNALKEKGLGLAVISYDSQEILKSFAERKSITYPLLSDVGSQVISRFGILNESIPKERDSYGVPYPGQYIVDARGVVQSKHFEKAYANRVTASSMLMRDLGSTPEALGRAETDELILEYGVSNLDAGPAQVLTISLNVNLKDRMHVYAPGIEDFIPIEWSLKESSLFTADEPRFPEPEMLELKAIGKTAPVYHGQFRILHSIRLTGQRELSQALGNLRQKPGELTIEGTLKYQACDDEVCYFPQEIPVSFIVRVHAFESK